MVDLEHRFYGESIPLNDSSVSNLVHLSSPQALADVAAFVPVINARYNLSASHPWIVTGGSYSGSLAAWARLKYPHLFIGSLAISGPLQASVDFRQYLEVVQAVLPANCSSFLRAGNDAVSNLLAGGVGSSGWQQLEKDMNLCSPGLTSAFDVSAMIERWADTFMSTVQYARGNDVQELCSSFMASSAEPYTALIKYFFSSQQCTNVNFDDMVKAETQPGDDRSSDT